jgi:hypothetical protein
MTPIATALAARAVFTVAVAVGTLAVTAHQANAFSLRVKMACASEYYANCSAYSLQSQEVRSCMRAVGAGLSVRCSDALVADGEVSAAEVARKRAAAKSASAN